MPKSDPSKSAKSVRQMRGEAARLRRRDEVEARAALMAALVRGESHAAIADRHGVDVTTVRRRLRQEFEARPPLATRDHASVQIARLERAVRAFDEALDAGDWRAAAAFPRVVEALDRYHGFVEASGRAEEQRRRLVANDQRQALAAPPGQLTTDDLSATRARDDA